MEQSEERSKVRIANISIYEFGQAIASYEFGQARPLGGGQAVSGLAEGRGTLQGGGG